MNITTELNLATNLFGSLGVDIRRRIIHYIAKPTAKGWDDIHGIIINNGVGFGFTIWQAVIAIDPTFPKTGRSTNLKGKTIEEWAKIPTSELIEKALRYGTH